MLYKLGRFLQLLGLIITPAGIAGNVVPGSPLTLGESLAVASLGVGVFSLGWWLQQKGRPG